MTNPLDVPVPKKDIITGVRRYDRVQLKGKPRRDESTGFLRVDASLTRAPAVFPYMRADGTIQYELRMPEHVFSDQNIDSIRGSVLTNEHPDVKVTSRNVRRFQVGQPESGLEVNDDLLDGRLVVTDTDTVDDMTEGKRDISLGYDCDLVMKPGTWTDHEGKAHHYDAIQVNHRTNHIAIVQQGRAGPNVRAHMDANDAYQVEAGARQMPGTKTPTPAARREDFFFGLGGENARVKISDRIDIELPIEKATLVADALADHENERRELATKHDALEAERDTLKTERDDLKKKVDADDEFEKRFDERVELLTKAASVLDEDGMKKARELKAEDLKKVVVQKVRGDDFKVDDKSAEYIDAAFDLIEVEERDDEDAHGLRYLSSGINSHKGKNDEGLGKHEDEIEKSMRRDDELWREKVPGSYHHDGGKVPLGYQPPAPATEGASA